MSLILDGVWKVGVFSTTIFGEGVWSEGQVVVVAEDSGGGILSRANLSRNTLIKWLRKEQTKKQPFKSLDKKDLVKKFKETGLIQDQSLAESEEEAEAILFIMVNLRL